jgi:hypothetical protein
VNAPNEASVPPKCPFCGRLTVDNAQHCPDLKPGRWALVCMTIQCRCGGLYRAGAQHKPKPGDHLGRR